MYMLNVQGSWQAESLATAGQVPNPVPQTSHTGTTPASAETDLGAWKCPHMNTSKDRPLVGICKLPSAQAMMVSCTASLHI